MKTKANLGLLLLVLLLGIVAACSSGDASDPDFSVGSLDLSSISLVDRLASGKPTLAEFGRGTCIPCKKMKPILEELALEYDSQINIVIVEIQDHEDLTRKYKIMTIPTQIFFDSTGKEVSRHIGFYPKADIVSDFHGLGMINGG